jgi:hypothetical protein
MRDRRHCVDDSANRTRLRELAAERRRFSRRRLKLLLEREGIRMNHKKLWRLYAEERLQVLANQPCALQPSAWLATIDSSGRLGYFEMLFTKLPKTARRQTGWVPYCLIQECCRVPAGCLIAMFPLHHLLRQLTVTPEP